MPGSFLLMQGHCIPPSFSSLSYEMPDMLGVRLAISSQISDGWVYLNSFIKLGLIFLLKFIANSEIIFQSGRLLCNGFTSFLTLWTLLSLFVKVPSFSAKVVAGNTISAISAVSWRNISWTINSSSFLNDSSAWCKSGSLNKGFSPVIYIAFILPVFICSTISVTTNPCSLGRVNPPQAVSNFLILVGLITWYPGNEFGRQPASPQPWTLFCPLNGEIPDPGLPNCPVSRARLSKLCALAVPFVCWVIPIPQIKHEPLNLGEAYNFAASKISEELTPVIFSAYSRVYFSIIFDHSLNPSVLWSINSLSNKFWSNITFAIALNSVTSVPGNGLNHISA